MLRSRHSASSHPLRGRRPVVALVAVAAVVGLVGSTTPFAAQAESDINLASGDRVLQSVNVQVGSDGTLTSISSEAVAADADGAASDTATEAFSPSDVVDDLPVRVTTSYRTADGAGTDLSELEGYTGKIQIDLTVENLTVTPRDLTYDVDGSSRSQPALVGVPLTVVASAALPGVPGSSVVTEEQSRSGSTNGVLSQSEEGVTQVQWATILAPPQLGSSARLGLVVDADDFTPPDFDLSIQPGLVTDSSVGALVDAAFNPASSDERELQARTIKVIGEVNEVLGRAGSSISDVRGTLESSAANLGQKTVRDLRSSVTQIGSTMRRLDGTLDSLGGDLSSTLESTGSSSIQQLQTSVKSINALLGDTTLKVTQSRVQGSACDLDVSTDKSGKSVYAALARVDSRLQAYAAATQRCKGNLQDSILKSIGSKDANETNCRGVESVACTIVGTKQSFAGITDQFTSDTQAALGALDPEANENVDLAADELVTRAQKARDAVLLLNGNFSVIYDDLKALKNQRDALKAAVGSLRDQASGLTGSGSSLGQAKDQNYLLASKVCADAALGNVEQNTARQIVGALVDEYPLPACLLMAFDGQGNKLTPPAPLSGRSMQSLLEQTTDGIDSIVAKLDLDDTSVPTDPAELEAAKGKLGPAFVTLDDAIATLEKELAVFEDSTVNDGSGARALQYLVVDTYGQALLIKRETQAILGQYAAATQGVNDAIAKARKDAEGKINQQIQDGIRQVTDRADADRAAIGKAFDNSSRGLSQAGDGILSEGKSTINDQKRVLAANQRSSANGIDKLVDQGLTQIAKGVRASSRDNAAVTALLTDDLADVLRDIGQPGAGADGTGLLGSLATNAATAGTADFQLALATRATTSYANVRGQDVAGLLLRQAQAEASFSDLAALPAFGIDVPSGVERRTIYVFHVTGR